MKVSLKLVPVQDQFDGLMQVRCNSIANTLELCLSCTNPSNWWSVSIDSGDGLVLNRQKTVTWTTGDQVHWCLYASPSLKELMINNCRLTAYLKKYLYRQSQYSNTWDSKCLALIAQVVRAFGMNPMVGGSSPPQVETFSVSKSLTLSQEYPLVSQKWMLLPAHS